MVSTHETKLKVKTINNNYAELVTKLREVNEIHKKNLYQNEQSLSRYLELSDTRVENLIKQIDVHNTLSDLKHKEIIRDYIFNDLLGIDINSALDSNDNINMDDLKMVLDFHIDNK